MNRCTARRPAGAQAGVLTAPGRVPQQCGTIYRATTVWEVPSFPELDCHLFPPVGIRWRRELLQPVLFHYGVAHFWHEQGEMVLCATQNSYDRLLYEFPVARKRRVTASLSPARIGGRLSMLLVILGATLASISRNMSTSIRM